ncbi:MAG: YkgJ family cysteine cluster protein [Deltaproteobacteria bacterium]|nr:YkgJ family cysteine cluster protein [Deltaproteobacteria bacterium]
MKQQNFIVGWKPFLEALTGLYLEVDRRVMELSVAHAGRLQCRRGCKGCCVDELTVFGIEAENIRRHHGDLLKDGAPHKKGACAFLDENGLCRIYQNRPYVCRTQGLPLRWIDVLADGTPVEMRDICPLNEGEKSVESLPADLCWSIGPFEERLARLQAGADGERLRRVPLRLLFALHDPWADTFEPF